VVVDIEWSGISTGTERLLWAGRMPPFPGMGYPLVPGYESVGRVSEAGAQSGAKCGDSVFVLARAASARCAAIRRGRSAARGSGRARRPSRNARRAARAPGARRDAPTRSPARSARLIVGHGVLGRFLARLRARAARPSLGAQPERATATATGCSPGDPAATTADLHVSGDAADPRHDLIAGAPAGEIVLAGFYAERSFAFPPAFMREARIGSRRKWREAPTSRRQRLSRRAALARRPHHHHRAATEADDAYRTAFGDPGLPEDGPGLESCS
jgi:3-hydroxyethyl bacteriochlorophyllide a dehydrogenase